MVGEPTLTPSLKRTWGWRIAISSIAAFLGVIFTLQAQNWWVSIRPNIVQIASIEVKPLPDNGWLLFVTLSGPPSPNCLRISQHLMYQKPVDQLVVLHRTDGNDELPDFLPLGSAMNGLGFNSPAYDIRVVLKIHPGTPLGTWNYIDRSAYFCTELGLSRIVQSQTAPREIILKRDQ